MAVQSSDFRAVDPLLTGAVYGAVPSQMGFLCEEADLLESQDVGQGQHTGTMWVETRDAYMGAEGDGDLRRAPGAAHNRIGNFAPFTETYSVTNKFGAEAEVVDEARRGSQVPFDLVARAAQQLEIARLIRCERDLASVLWTGSNFSRALDAAGSGAGDLANVKADAGAAKWNAAGSTAYTDMQLATELFVEDNGGLTPDTIICPLPLAMVIGRNEEVRGIIGDSTAGVTSAMRPVSLPMVRGIISEATGVSADRIFIVRSRYKTNREGATLAESYIWTSTTFGMFCLRGAAPIPGAGGGLNVRQAAMIRLRDAELSGYDQEYVRGRKSTLVYANDYYQHKLIPSASGGSTTTLGLHIEECF